jgi:hypothetical protein
VYAPCGSASALAALLTTTSTPPRVELAEMGRHAERLAAHLL